MLVPARKVRTIYLATFSYAPQDINTPVLTDQQGLTTFILCEHRMDSRRLARIDGRYRRMARERLRERERERERQTDRQTDRQRQSLCLRVPHAIFST